MGMYWRSKVVPFPNYRLHVSRGFFDLHYFEPIPCLMCHWIGLDMLFASLDGSVSYFCIPCEFRIIVTRKIWTNTEWHRNAAFFLYAQCTILFHCPHLTLTWPMVRIIWFGVYTYPKPCFFRLDRFGFIIHAYMWVFYGVLRIEDLPWMQESNGRISRMKKQLGLNHLLLCTSR